jgi:putative DeoR family transcriptional regulator (stage III sporulation protein D)
MKKYDFIKNRVLEEAHYIINTKDNIRSTAKKFMTSKSTVHKDITERLPKLNAELYEMAREILDFNLHERHIRGGAATRRKFKES